MQIQWQHMANNGVEAAVQKASAKLPSGIYEGSMIDELSACAKASSIILVVASVSTSVCLRNYGGPNTNCAS